MAVSASENPTLAGCASSMGSLLCDTLATLGNTNTLEYCFRGLKLLLFCSTATDELLRRGGKMCEVSLPAVVKRKPPDLETLGEGVSLISGLVATPSGIIGMLP